MKQRVYTNKATLLLCGMLIYGTLSIHPSPRVYGAGQPDTPKNNTPTIQTSPPPNHNPPKQTPPQAYIYFVVEITQAFDIEVLRTMLETVPEITIGTEGGISTRYVQIICKSAYDNTQTLTRIRALEGVIRVYEDAMRSSY